MKGTHVDIFSIGVDFGILIVALELFYLSKIYMLKQ